MTEPGNMVDQPRHTNSHVRLIIVSAAVGAAATILLIVGGWLSWRFYAQWRAGRIELTNDGVPLTVQVLSESGAETIGEPIDLVRHSTLVLPDGDYRLRVSGIGRLSETFRFAVNRGETQAHSVSLDHSRMLREYRFLRSAGEKRIPEQPMLYAPTTVPLEVKPGVADHFEWNFDSLIRRDGVTGRVVWDARQPEKPFAKGRDPAAWIKPFSGMPGEATIVQPASDLDGDGLADFVCAFRRTPSLLALSGKDGSMLWTYTAELDGPGGPQPEGPDLVGINPESRPGTVVGVPAVIDCDRDGTPDLIATVALSESPREVQKRTGQTHPGLATSGQASLARRVVVAVSGRSGRSIWSHRLDKEFAVVPEHSWKRAAAAVGGRAGATLAILDDARLKRLDPATGQSLGEPLEIGFEPIRNVQHADLDGDGEPDMLALGPGPQTQRQTLAAFATKPDRELWVQTVMAPFEPADGRAPWPEWPLVVDLDGDGRCEIVVPDSGMNKTAGGYRGVKMLDGASGETRWVRPMRPDTKADDRVQHIAAAPDLDRDGTRDLVILSRFDGRQPAAKPNIDPPEPTWIYVDAISGSNGHPLWWWRVEFEHEQQVSMGATLSFGRGSDGWPLLVVSPGEWYRVNSGGAGDRPAAVHVLEASTGREVHRVEGLLSPAVADFDGDGLGDLWGAADGQLRAFRGPMPEAWRALGFFNAAGSYHGPPDDRGNHTADFNGDGIGDALAGAIHSPSARDAPGSRTVVARSGHDGHTIWKTSIDARPTWSDDERMTFYEAKTLGLPAGDLDGDGTCDVFVKIQLNYPGKSHRAATIPLELLSGRTGRHLWSAGNRPLALENPGNTLVQSFNVCMIEPHRAPAVLTVLSTSVLKPGATPTPGDPFEYRLVRLSGRDGRVVWDKLLLGQRQQFLKGGMTEPTVGDLDGDGSLDAVVLIPLSNPQENRGFELRAVSLRDGEPIWSRNIPSIHQDFYPDVTVGDLDGDNRAEIIIVNSQPLPGNKVETALSLLEGRDGETRWHWHDRSEGASNSRGGGSAFLGDFSGTRQRSVCLRLTTPAGQHQILIFDALGQQTARRDLSKGQLRSLTAADLNGDGRDELLISLDQGLHVVGSDLKEIWSRPHDQFQVGFVNVPRAGTTPTLVVHPAIGLDAANGHPRWAGDDHGYPFNIWQVTLLDPGDATRLPLLFPWSSRQVCYQALPATAAGKYAPPQGTPVPPGLARYDPRWTRPLPWTTRLAGILDLKGFLYVMVLTLVNLVLPLMVLRLAARRRPWSVRFLMALPLAVAIPLMALIALEPMIEGRPDRWVASAKLELALGTLAGVPLLAVAATASRYLSGRRLNALAALVAIIIVSSAAIGAAWLWFDIKSMPSIEHYGWAGWHLILVPGAYATGLLVLMVWALRMLFGLVRLAGRARPVDVLPHTDRATRGND